MKIRRGIFAVVIDNRGNLLILHRILNWRGWEVPKGGIDGKGGEGITLRKELQEELGFHSGDYEVIGKSNTHLQFPYPSWYQKKWKVSKAQFRGWLVRAKRKKISFKKNLEREHDDYLWLPIERGVKKLKQANQRAAVRSVLKRFSAKIKGF